MLGRSSICAVCQSLTVRIGVAGAQGSAQFEGVPAGSDGYSSGFGLTAEPHITVETLTSPPPPPTLFRQGPTSPPACLQMRTLALSRSAVFVSHPGSLQQSDALISQH